MMRLLAFAFAWAFLADACGGPQHIVAIWDPSKLVESCGKHGRAVSSEPIVLMIFDTKEHAQQYKPLQDALVPHDRVSGHIVTCGDGATVMVRP